MSCCTDSYVEAEHCEQGRLHTKSRILGLLRAASTSLHMTASKTSPTIFSQSTLSAQLVTLLWFMEETGTCTKPCYVVEGTDEQAVGRLNVLLH